LSKNLVLVSAVFQAEWEALEICNHEWALDDVDSGLFGAVHHQTDMHKNKLS